MKETAPQRYELPNAPPNKALVFLPWKRKGDNEATAGAPPKAGTKNTIFTSRRDFLIFHFPTFRPVTTSDLSPLPPSAHQPSAHQPPTEATETPVFTPQNLVAVNYTTYGKITPYSPIMSLIWVLPRVMETSQKTFYQKSAVFSSVNCVNLRIYVILPSEV